MRARRLGAGISTRAARRRSPPLPRVDAGRIRAILAGLRRHHPEARCALEHRNPFELLVATILSAQCTDKRVNMVTPELFRRYPTPAALATAPRAAVEEIIRSTGFFRSKARSLQEMSRDLAQHHGGEVPRSLDELVRLQGVGRKTANVVLGTAFGIASGVVVDTHVKRISRRLGLTRHGDPVKIERDLMALLPRQEWVDFSHRVIWHGRGLCGARRPRCAECGLSSVCPTGEKELARRPRPLPHG
jgi:endonuclease-3